MEEEGGRIEKIILYGSYARGGWVEEPHTAKGYRSDFDLLIIVNDKQQIEELGSIVSTICSERLRELANNIRQAK